MIKEDLNFNPLCMPFDLNPLYIGHHRPRQTMKGFETMEELNDGFEPSCDEFSLVGEMYGFLNWQGTNGVNYLVPMTDEWKDAQTA